MNEHELEGVDQDNVCKPLTNQQRKTDENIRKKAASNVFSLMGVHMIGRTLEALKSCLEDEIRNTLDPLKNLVNITHQSLKPMVTDSINKLRIPGSN